MNTVSFCLITVLLVGHYFHYGSALECYVCDRQHDNNGKCLQTIQTCEQGEDVCLSEIGWGSTPYWSPHASKQYYISKRCAVKEQCEKIRSKYMPYCTRLWYIDWKCFECCQGDRCNYYVILSGSIARSSFTVLFGGLVAVFVLWRTHFILS